MRKIIIGLLVAMIALLVGVVPFVLGSPAYLMLGYSYLAIAVTRAISIVFDKSYAQSNLISLVIEILFGAILVV